MKTNMKVWAFGEKVVLRCLWYFSKVNCIIFVLSDTIYVTRNTAIRLKDLGIFSCLFFSFCLITSEIFHSCKFWPFSWGSEREVPYFLSFTDWGRRRSLTGAPSSCLCHWPPRPRSTPATSPPWFQGSSVTSVWDWWMYTCIITSGVWAQVRQFSIIYCEFNDSMCFFVCRFSN